MIHARRISVSAQALDVNTNVPNGSVPVIQCQNLHPLNGE